MVAGGGGCVWFGGGCMGACVVARGHAWLPGGMRGCLHAWLPGACMVVGCVCMVARGHAWLPGVCVVAGGDVW